MHDNNFMVITHFFKYQGDKTEVSLSKTMFSDVGLKAACIDVRMGY